MRFEQVPTLALLNHFCVQEFVPSAVYSRFGERAIEQMDRRIVISIEQLRGNLIAAGYDNPITINNWVWGGPRQYSGLRTPQSADYSNTSQHSRGRAIDGVSKTPIEVIHKHILENLHLYPHIRFIEIDIGWLHIDCRDNACGKPVVCWSPKRGFVSPETYLKEL